MGAELNAGTDKEGTTVYARMLDQHLPRAFEVMADMVWRPAFNDVDPEREVVLEEIAMYEDDPQDTVFDVLGDAVFGDHPLGRPIIGRAPVIRDTPVDRIAGVPRAPLRARRRSSWPPRARSTTTRSWRWPSGRWPACAPASARRCPTRRRRCRTPACASRPRRPSRSTSASAARASRATTSAASRCACSTRSSAACRPRGCSRACARSAGSPTPSTRSRASSPTRARSASTSARGRTTSPRR